MIEIAGLRKTYGSLRRDPHHAVDGLNMSVDPHQVHGFLGPNGSGKTTTLRALLGLIKTDEGEMRLFGHPVPNHLPSIIHRVGAVVEAPRFFPSISARKTLQLLAHSVGIPMVRVEEVLDQVGLRQYAKYKVGGFSLGMKQRLAVAQAMMKKPELLILDEPANGLDPAGIHQMRVLLRTLASDFNATVLVSSHALSEVEVLCDSVTIISQGQRVRSGSMTDLISASQSDELLVEVKSDQVSTAMEILQTEPNVGASWGDGRIHITGVTDPAWVTEILSQQNVFLSGLSRRSTNLEEVFLQITADGRLESPRGGELCLTCSPQKYDGV